MNANKITKLQTKQEKLNAALGQIIASVRINRGLTQRDLANQSNLSSAGISRIENGGGARLRSLLNIAEAFHLDLSELIQNAEYKAKIRRPGPCACKHCQQLRAS